MDKYERFEAWLRENGAKFDQVGTALHWLFVFAAVVGSGGVLFYQTWRLVVTY